jgi:hypothetical protein
MLRLYCLLLCAASVISFRSGGQLSIGVKAFKCTTTSNFRLHAEKSSGEDDTLTRRKKRRGKKEPESPVTAARAPVELRDIPIELPRMGQSGVTNSDGSSSLEDLFGLGTDQLRELMEQELPVPREDVSTGKVVKETDTDKNKVFKLPDLSEFMGGGGRGSKDTSRITESGEEEEEEPEEKVDRSNQAEYLRVLQLNPFADADDSKFKEEYDIFASIFGTGQLLNIPIPYLQQGHGMLLVITLIAALIYAPGNPLTEFPVEIRNFLKQGLVNIYAVNFVLAGRSIFVAKEKNLPAFFWAAKTLVLGGLAFFEVTQARDPTKLNTPDPSDRKSKRRNNK